MRGECACRGVRRALGVVSYYLGTVVLFGKVSLRVSTGMFEFCRFFLIRGIDGGCLGVFCFFMGYMSGWRSLKLGVSL